MSTPPLAAAMPPAALPVALEAAAQLLAADLSPRNTPYTDAVVRPEPR